MVNIYAADDILFLENDRLSHNVQALQVRDVMYFSLPPTETNF
jgi:hypothetical protein